MRITHSTREEPRMALHDNKSVRDQIDDDVYASVDLSVSMPKYKFPAAERDPRHAYCSGA